MYENQSRGLITCFANTCCVYSGVMPYMRNDDEKIEIDKHSGNGDARITLTSSVQ